MTFNAIFPIVSHNGLACTEFVSYHLSNPSSDAKECQQRGLTFHSTLRAKVRLIINDREDPTKVKEIKEQEVYMGEIPLMTSTSSFVISGTERVIVSQLHHSPGMLLEHDRGKTHSSGKLLFSARIIPYRGSWLDLEFDPKDILYFRADRRRKMPVTILLKSIGLTPEQILAHSFVFDNSTLKTEGALVEFVPERLRGEVARFGTSDKNGKVVVEKDKRINAKHIRDLNSAGTKLISIPEDYLLGRVLTRNIVNPDIGEALVNANDELTEGALEKLRGAGVKKIQMLYTNDLDQGPYTSVTLRTDDTADQTAARIAIYRMVRPGGPPTENVVEALLQRPSYSEDSYDLSCVGRMKVSNHLNCLTGTDPMVLTDEDILDTIKLLVNLRNGKGEVDDIDHLGNHRIRCVGELAENQFHAGLSCVKCVTKEHLSQAKTENLIPHDLINSKPTSSAACEFFGSSQLSQFMDQANPLLEVTYKRCISALGSGGLTCERADSEVRDMYSTHYDRVCPIETSEDPNIGLINPLALYAQLNNYDFPETPYRKVESGRLTDQVDYLSAIEEGKYVVVQANATLDKNGNLIDELVSVHEGNERETRMVTLDRVRYIDAAPPQIVSAAASLVPFLEHDDADCALTGMNMQCQAVPCLCTNKPLVGIGVERTVVVDSGTAVQATRGGVANYVDASCMVIRVNDDETVAGEVGVDVYNLIKYTRSNQNTNISQRLMVKVGDIVTRGGVITDGASTDMGELVLGQNMLVAFMPWNGYNSEDSILISEHVVAKDHYTSIRIEELSIVVRDTRLGPKKITCDTSNLVGAQPARPDKSGVTYIGAEMEAGDMLIGKVTPKGEIQLMPEEKLLRVIFGEKASGVEDTSLRMPSGMSGTVIGVQVFMREGVVCDRCAWSIIDEELKRYHPDLDDQLCIVEGDAFQRLERLLVGEAASGGPKKLAKGTVFAKEYLADLDKWHWSNIRPAEGEVALQLETVKVATEQKRHGFDLVFEEERKKLTQGNELPPGVIKMMKVCLAVKRCLQPGDKMAGHHGSKDAVSKITPIEDMPYMADSTPADIVLNPPGMLSRMNTGQILETHLGWAVYGLGEHIGNMSKVQARAVEICKLLGQIYNEGGKVENLDSLSDAEILELAENLEKGIPLATLAFDGVHEDKIRRMLDLAYPEDIAKEKGLTASKQQVMLFGDCTGEAFERPVTLGAMHVLRLHHSADDKTYARSIGPYLLVMQQPLGDKAQFGGQRLGEMEVWALEAYGASYVLQEMLTVKSDDVNGRAKVYENIVRGEHSIGAGVSESFNVLVKEIRSLGIDIDLKCN